MARRRSLNRKSRRSSINVTAVLDEDSRYYDDEDETYWRHIPDFTRRSNRVSLADQSTVPILNPNSGIIDDSDDDGSEWWNILQKTSQDLFPATVPTAREPSEMANVSNTTSASEANYSTKVIKKRRVILGKNRMSTDENVFSQALESSEATIELEPALRNSRKQSRQLSSESIDELELRRVDQQSRISSRGNSRHSPESNTSADTEVIARVRPTFFRRSKKTSFSRLDELLQEDDDSIVGPSQNLCTNKDNPESNVNSRHNSQNLTESPSRKQSSIIKEKNERHEGDDNNKTREKEFLTQQRSTFDKIKNISQHSSNYIVNDSGREDEISDPEIIDKSNRHNKSTNNKKTEETRDEDDFDICLSENSSAKNIDRVNEGEVLNLSKVNKSLKNQSPNNVCIPSSSSAGSINKTDIHRNSNLPKRTSNNNSNDISTNARKKNSRSFEIRKNSFENISSLSSTREEENIRNQSTKYFNNAKTLNVSNERVLNTNNERNVKKTYSHSKTKLIYSSDSKNSSTESLTESLKTGNMQSRTTRSTQNSLGNLSLQSQLNDDSEEKLEVQKKYSGNKSLRSSKSKGSKTYHYNEVDESELEEQIRISEKTQRSSTKKSDTNQPRYEDGSSDLEQASVTNNNHQKSLRERRIKESLPSKDSDEVSELNKQKRTSNEAEISNHKIRKSVSRTITENRLNNDDEVESSFKYQTSESDEAIFESSRKLSPKNQSSTKGKRKSVQKRQKRMSSNMSSKPLHQKRKDSQLNNENAESDSELQTSQSEGEINKSLGQQRSEKIRKSISRTIKENRLNNDDEEASSFKYQTSESDEAIFESSRELSPKNQSSTKGERKSVQKRQKRMSSNMSSKPLHQNRKESEVNNENAESDSELQTSQSEGEINKSLGQQRSEKIRKSISRTIKENRLNNDDEEASSFKYQTSESDEAIFESSRELSPKNQSSTKGERKSVQKRQNRMSSNMSSKPLHQNRKESELNNENAESDSELQTSQSEGEINKSLGQQRSAKSHHQSSKDAQTPKLKIQKKISSNKIQNSLHKKKHKDGSESDSEPQVDLSEDEFQKSSKGQKSKKTAEENLSNTKNIEAIDPSAYELPDRDRSGSISESDVENVQKYPNIHGVSSLQTPRNEKTNISENPHPLLDAIPSTSNNTQLGKSINKSILPKPNTLDRFISRGERKSNNRQQTSNISQEISNISLPISEQQKLKELEAKLKKLKAESDKKTEKMIAEMFKNNSKQASATGTKPNVPVNNNDKVKSNTNKTKKPVDKAYIVNGKVYKPPPLPRPQKWVTNRLYKYLWKKMEPKYGSKTRITSEEFILYLSDKVKFINRTKKYKNYKDELDVLIKKMAKLDLVKTRLEFHHFCYDFLPYEFRIKVNPQIMPGNIRNIPFDPAILTIPILGDN